MPSWSYAEEKLNRTVYVEGGGFSDMGEDVQDHSLFVYGDIMEKEAAFLRSHIPPERVYLNLTMEFMAMSGKYADVRLSVDCMTVSNTMMAPPDFSKLSPLEADVDWS